MEALYKESYSVEDIYALPDGVRAELFDGQIHYMSPPSTKHQTLVMNISYVIKNHINKKGCRPTAFLLLPQIVKPQKLKSRVNRNIIRLGQHILAHGVKRERISANVIVFG